MGLDAGRDPITRRRLAVLTGTFIELHRWILYRGPSSYRVILALVKPERKLPRQAQCGCGAVVAHHLAKVRVASSNLVIRSSVTQSGGKHQTEFARVSTQNTVTWPRGEAAACKAVHTGSNPVVTSQWAIGAAVARFPDTEEVTGSIPVRPTQKWWYTQAGSHSDSPYLFCNAIRGGIELSPMSVTSPHCRLWWY